MKTEDYNPFIKQIVGNLDTFIESIKCLKETFEYSEGTLKQQLDRATKSYDNFVKKLTLSEKGDPIIPIDRVKEFEKIEKKKKRAEKAQQLIPPSYIVSLVSIFDSFYAGLIRSIYVIQPDKLKASSITFNYKELADFDSINDVKKVIVDSIVDTQLRESHAAQINWLENAIDVKTLRAFDGWGAFIELTERRNLFVHADGIVSSQYISECKKNKYNLSGISVGSKLNVDKKYFESSYDLLYMMAIMLTQIIINKLYNCECEQDTAIRDKVFINNVYELISDEHYSIAILVSDMIMKSSFKHNGKDRSFIILNQAQAYKWSGNQEACLKLLASEDTSAWNDELLIPKLVLEDKFEEVYAKMKRLGDKSNVLNQSAYCEWPIFKEIREQEKFAETFKDIFNKELASTRTLQIDDEEYEVFEVSEK